MKKCTKCGAENIDSAKFCKHCGNPFDEDCKYCQKCGAKNVLTAKFCAECGSQFAETKPETESSNQETANNGNSNSVNNNDNTKNKDDNQSSEQQQEVVKIQNIKKEKIKKVLKIILCVIVAGAVGFGIYWHSLPDYTITPETTEVEFDCDGGEEEIEITTDADFASWHVNTDKFWIEVIKNESSLTIKCDENNFECEGARYGSVSLYCDGKNSHKKITIKVKQEEADITFGKIRDLAIEETNYEMSFEVSCHKFRNVNTDHLYYYFIWFYSDEFCDNPIKTSSDLYHDKNGCLCNCKKIIIFEGTTFRDWLSIPKSYFPKDKDIYCHVAIVEYEDDDDHEPRWIDTKDFSEPFLIKSDITQKKQRHNHDKDLSEVPCE